VNPDRWSPESSSRTARSSPGPGSLGPAPTFAANVNVVPIVSRVVPDITFYNQNGDGRLSMTVDLNGSDSYFAIALIQQG